MSKIIHVKRGHGKGAGETKRYSKIGILDGEVRSSEEFEQKDEALSAIFRGCSCPQLEKTKMNQCYMNEVFDHAFFFCTMALLI